ncbi:DDE-type integrase/transposase/recombinase [Streptomyces sp. NBC_01438]|uniref:DDE-type integrase/transposase/recombinase n=1 Tax=Streptomyces sp. NBC_01438 TaxID=2903866 RepID=UPI00352DB298
MRPASCRTTDAGRRAARPAPPTTPRDHDPRSQGRPPSRPHRPRLPARPHRARRRWCGDITYIPTDEGWLYLATVIDIASRRVVGWATADHLRTELVAEALTAAFRQRRPAHSVNFHSDRGC